MGGLGDFILPAAGAGVGALIGNGPGALAGGALGMGLAGSLDSMQMQADTNAANAQQAANQMQFQREMSSSAWQRGMLDMKMAGLNPILAVDKGPASSPSGAMATMNSPGAALAQGLANVSSNALQAAQNSIQNKGTDSQISLNAQREGTEQTQQALNQANAEYLANRTDEAEANARVAQNEADISDAGKSARSNMAGITPYLEGGKSVSQIGANALEALGLIRGIPIKMGGAGGAGGTQPQKWLGRDERDELKRQDMFNKAEGLFKKP